MNRAVELASVLAKRFEGIKDGDLLVPGLQPYRDPVGYWTIGYGHLITRDKKAACPNITWTLEEAEDNLITELGFFHRQVMQLTTSPLTDEQAAALTDFTYNVGRGNFLASTLRRKVNDLDYEGAADEFPKWKFAGGRILPGLIRRRQAERSRFLS